MSDVETLLYSITVIDTQQKITLYVSIGIFVMFFSYLALLALVECCKIRNSSCESCFGKAKLQSADQVELKYKETISKV